ncbi:DUF6527 family protein [Elizabethkingia ursingii]|uniref:Anaerobic dehydrogenase n=1 Tax=Elizabethkingia ursingii TaxID=1756150 RepID=A0AAJ3NAM6_9FLAO|nr:DUF6527 family protein [Elizabethkingia ursingii]AQX08019.1 hypothetical protein BBD34_04885 [Elizabethkingia ursingii]OPB73627.1 hypothetical protein BAY32_11335 [Elizabethkingia ursingii]
MNVFAEVEDHPGYYIFKCPGCGLAHYVNTNPEFGIVWQFNGNLVKPTISPSLFVNASGLNPTTPKCHSFIKEGKIEFLNDCTHELAGKIIDLTEI